MPWSGDGIFNRIYSWVADKAAGLDISSTRMDTDTDDIASNGFGNCLTRDGQGQPTADLPMAGFKHTGVANGVASTDYAAFGQIAAAQVNPVFTGTGSATLPEGTTAQRPGSPTGGMIRFNDQTSAFEGYDGAVWRNLNSPGGVGPQVQTFTSGTGATYTTPAGALFLVVHMVGSGGGGGGSGGGASAGGNGNTTSFNAVNASGGGGGAAATTLSGNAGGAGGASGTGAASFRFPGAAGNPGGNVIGGVPAVGGAGASSVFGGAGPAGTASINAGTAQANTGSGGGGAGSASSSFGAAGGGGAGEFAQIIISNPAATYSYSVGSGGAAGTGTTNGGAGANAVIIVTAYFQ
jgi:hypothetical protein